MADFEVTANQVVTVEPGDVLVIGHGGRVTAEEGARLKQALGLTAIIMVPGPVDLGVIKVEGGDQDVHVAVSPQAAAGMAEEVARVIRRQRRGR
ncbi:hypothetical protein [Streptomyces sp. NPDC001741]|uniref:hypothetical protein n=1 Tax=Streptomyces sp. NPDC001741 TaxID=3364605 RepID=UPI0036BDEA16